MSLKRCAKHNRDVTARCNWCGGGICAHCTNVRDGNKWYCEKCVSLLNVEKAKKTTAAGLETY